MSYLLKCDDKIFLRYSATQQTIVFGWLNQQALKI